MKPTTAAALIVLYGAVFGVTVAALLTHASTTALIWVVILTGIVAVACTGIITDLENKANRPTGGTMPPRGGVGGAA